MEEDFEVSESNAYFDFKGFIVKIFSYWYLFVISILIGMGIAYFINVRKQPIYQIESLITIKDDQNPFFTSNTSLTFNWGGVSDKVNTTVTTLKTRTHNEKVVNRLRLYLQYYEDGKYQKEDAYGKVPFVVMEDSLEAQLIGKELTIRFIDETSFELSLTFDDEDPGNLSYYNYTTKETENLYSKKEDYKETFKVSEYVNSPYFKGQVFRNSIPMSLDKPYYIRFTNYYSTVKKFQDINVSPENKGSSILNLSLNGNNKEKLVDYLNTTVQVLSEDMLNRKNLFATKTIRFIDSSLTEKSKELKSVEEELNQFKISNDIIDLTEESSQIRERLTNLDLEKNSIQRQIDYYNGLEQYLRNRQNYSDVPAPSVAGIDEPSISQAVGKIVALSEQRSKYSYSLKTDAPIFNDIDRQIDATKSVLLENIGSTENILLEQLGNIRRNEAELEKQIRALPKEQQDLLKIERRYTISEETYSLFLIKRNEAGLIKAANVSDVQIIDKAMDTGGGKIGPNTQLNYVMALLIGSFVPLVFVFLLVFLDNKINNPKDINKLSPIPLLGVVGKSKSTSNLAVFSKPRSAIAESFRGLRTSMQFIFKQQHIQGNKTILITSSVSGEGKTFTAINMASVFSMSGKKTLLIGLDLRKPKIFEDFDITNDIGVVNYLIGQNSVEEIIQKTNYENLDVIVSGPVPPNPSELLMGDKMDILIASLKENYDCVIMDTPPIGLVSDALNLGKYADASIYLLRQNYTKKAMLSVINDKYEKGEVKNISFILNYFQHKAKYGYGYDYGYGYGYGYGRYGNGYLQTEKKSSFRKRVKRKLKKIFKL
ncbi:Ptk-like tyrosine-protein kinase [Psychroflexus gondwanensis ACAM 44]|jgi:capsular exopolysaccharide synthesis family protein|uniref:non-specific protein-tyrosine kinase n=1 Tax=Psychroflexus gondwanensis ACAM 44 TaxID=1189619 RepID=N1WS05_9FLAO|nr:tyrosine-protein kinase family protein [Psychroflexus gondwanensis]EMY79987.1 Ptk-like tyrosine-protein kinase [Psychroflexus gondwanensis ACAM 44]